MPDHSVPPRSVAGHQHKHLEIARAIENSIRSGEVEPGSRLLGEHALAEKFNTSRGTIRRALEDLAQRSLISTQTGRGSFVTFDGCAIDSPEGWTHALLDRGIDLRVQILVLAIISDPELSARVGVESPRFLAIDRVRRLPVGSAVSLERSRIPATDALGNVPDHGLVEGSLTKTMRKAGLVPVSGEQWVQLLPLTRDAATIFERPVGTAFVHAVRITRDAANHTVEHVTSILDPDHFRIHTTF